MDTTVQIVEVDAGNVPEQGFFCYKSKRKSKGYRRKLAWLEQRFSEGMRIKILFEGKRSVGFIEYIPGGYAWRAVQAEGYLVIHCLWVVGRAKQKGYGSRLVEACVAEARERQMAGVAMVTSSRPWLAGKELFLRLDFEEVDQAPPSFALLVKRLGAGPAPVFPKNWDERLSRYGPGLTVVRSDQCPYIEAASAAILESAANLGLQARAVELTTCQEVQELAPSAYGVFNVVKDGELLSYRYINEEGLRKLLEGRAG